MRAALLRRTAVAVVALAVSAVVSSPPAHAGPAGQPGYRPPVEAPIIDPFRPPSHHYGPGNRGIEYATTPGTPVTAVAGGEVSFAGQVGGTLHVTVLHADGLRSTVSYLAEISVRRGELVVGGETLGSAGPRTHLGVRAGDEYLDPAGLFASAGRSIKLIPNDEARSATAADERAAIAAWLAARPSGLDQAGEWLRNRATDGVVIARGLQPVSSPMGIALDTSIELYERLSDPSPCTPAVMPVGTPAERRIVVLVGGLGSTSTNAAVDDVDVEALGYDAADVYRFSYAGGRVPDRSDRLQHLRSTGYDSADTQTDLDESGARLAHLVAELVAAEPGVTVDVIAHSQGGLVTRVALDALAGEGGLDPLGAVATLGTPHQGADLATGAAVLRIDSSSASLFAAVDAAADTGLGLGTPSMRQLAPASGFIDRLTAAGVPDDVSFTSIGARGDLVVPANRTVVEDEHHVVVSLSGLTAHDALPGSAFATRELALAIAGRAPTCRSATDVTLDVLSGRVISHGEQFVGAGLLVAGLATPG